MGALGSGAFAGVLIPLFIWLWTEPKSRMSALAGLAGASAVVFATQSSTSWLAYGAGLLGLGLWTLRQRMRVVRWGLVIVLLGLHIVMHGPVWSLIEKIDLTGGSSNYHRYMLVDNCIRHFGDWWLLGSKSYGDWGFVMFDVCNQFVLNALRGGLLTLVIYIAIYKCGFAAIGRARKRVNGDRSQELLLWCLGSVLFATVVASFGINFTVQLMILFSCLLAGIVAATRAAKRATPPKADAPGTQLASASVSDVDGADLTVSATHLSIMVPQSNEGCSPWVPFGGHVSVTYHTFWNRLSVSPFVLHRSRRSPLPLTTVPDEQRIILSGQ